MNATQQAEFRHRLLADRERLITEWESHGGDDWDLRDPEERATQIISGQIERRIAEDDLKLLRKIVFALQRLDDGSYGLCAHCGQFIPHARLLAKPSVSLCLACQMVKDTVKS